MRFSYRKLLSIIFLLLLWLAPVQAQDISEARTVLVLHDLRVSGDWQSLYTDSLEDYLRGDFDYTINFAYEYLGLELVPDGERPEEIISHLAYKHVADIDLVVALLPTANNFLLNYGDEIFLDVPKIFVLPSEADASTIIDTQQGIVIETAARVAIENTLLSIPQLLPETEHIFVVSGSGTGDMVYLQQTQTILDSLDYSQIDVAYLVDFSVEEIQARLSNLPPNSVIMFLSFAVDRDGNRQSIADLVTRMSPLANAPIFTFSDNIMGYGVLGGNLTSATLYGETTAAAAQQILAGTFSSDEPRITGSSAYIFDWRELQRWDIPENQLPADSDVRFKTFSFWETHRNVILTIIVVILVQAALIIALLFALDQRRRAEQAIRKREIEFRAIFENSRDAISVSSQGIVIMVNPAFLKMFGYTHESEMIGQPVGINSVPEERERIATYSRQRGSDENIPIRYETVGRKVNGEVFDLETDVASYKLNDLIFNVAILRNISERKRFEALTREAEVLQTELEKEKKILSLRERFISILSHEFRNPLAVIQTSLDLLTRYKNMLTEERRDEALHKIKIQIQNLSNLIDDTLTLLRSQSDYIEFKPGAADVEQLCQDILDQIKLTDKENHQFQFISQIDDTLLLIDSTLLKHVLTNLLTNAVKYSPEDSLITIELRQEGEKIRLRVRDEGIGIPEEDQIHLFEPFHRASNVGNRQGSGLGLSIVQQYVKLHGGTISVLSELGKGSTFEIILPKVVQSKSFQQAGK